MATDAGSELQEMMELMQEHMVVGFAKSEMAQEAVRRTLRREDIARSIYVRPVARLPQVAEPTYEELRRLVGEAFRATEPFVEFCEARDNIKRPTKAPPCNCAKIGWAHPKGIVGCEHGPAEPEPVEPK